MQYVHFFTLIPFRFNGNTDFEHIAVLVSKSCNNRPQSAHNFLRKKKHSDEEKKFFNKYCPNFTDTNQQVSQGQSGLLLHFMSKNICLISLDTLGAAVQTTHVPVLLWMMFVFPVSECYPWLQPAIALSGSPMTMDNLSKKKSALVTSYIF